MLGITYNSFIKDLLLRLLFPETQLAIHNSQQQNAVEFFIIVVQAATLCRTFYADVLAVHGSYTVWQVPLPIELIGLVDPLSLAAGEVKGLSMNSSMIAEPTSTIILWTLAFDTHQCTARSP